MVHEKEVDECDRCRLVGSSMNLNLMNVNDWDLGRVD